MLSLLKIILSNKYQLLQRAGHILVCTLEDGRAATVICMLYVMGQRWSDLHIIFELASCPTKKNYNIILHKSFKLRKLALSQITDLFMIIF